MAQLWTTGPALIYSTAGQSITYNSTGNGTITFTGTPIFVGTAETKPRISIRRSVKEVQNDLGGDKPFDLNEHRAAA